jgi:hypothetical protein
MKNLKASNRLAIAARLAALPPPNDCGTPESAPPWRGVSWTPLT